MAKRFFVGYRFPILAESPYPRGFQADRIRVIPWGRKPRTGSFDSEEAKRKLGLTGRLVVYTSPLRLNKGILQVLQAVGLIRDRFPEVLVLATGVTDRQTQEQVRRFLTEHRLRDLFSL